MGTGSNAQTVAGYRVGGKTGTSEKIDEFDENGQPVDDKIVSFVGDGADERSRSTSALVALDTPSTATGYVHLRRRHGQRRRSADVLAERFCRIWGVEPEYSDEDDLHLVDVTAPQC